MIFENTPSRSTTCNVSEANSLRAFRDRVCVREEKLWEGKVSLSCVNNRAN